LIDTFFFLLSRYSCFLLSRTLASKGYAPKTALVPTNEIQKALSDLKELYQKGFIMHGEYEARLGRLEAAKKYSFVDIVPHRDLGMGCRLCFVLLCVV
jgi:hypothetical protein